ncbi:hypothetical protein NP493_314g02070 [Ridgeia piscesae]|uniref:Uncharacterized protein n=1 Tax=Ridgeia piscesae TaxID=27915 RepID=A0AAD9L712_RIDPI|nr:hypothetical protein NP493_314g02070 [Ridgeia piscesae]
MMGRLRVDLFFQDRDLLNGVDVKIRLMQSKNAFALMAGGDNPDYKITIDEAVLFARKAKLNPAVQMDHVKALEKGTAKYPLRRVHCKLEQTVNVVVYGEFESVLEIDRKRNIVYDY